MKQKDELTIDTFYNKGLIVKQFRFGYRYSIDAVLLSNYITVQPRDKIVDLGTGCGILPLLIACRHSTGRLYGIEIQPKLYELARQNVRANSLEDRIKIVREDLRCLSTRSVDGTADIVLTNPPYYKKDSGRLNPLEQRAIARHEIRATIADVIGAANRLLKNTGRFFAIYSTERTADLLEQMRANQLEPKHLRFIHPFLDKPAKLFLVEGVKGGRPGLKVAPPLIIYTSGHDYTREVAVMF